jgi:hypothetical protein
MTKTTILDESQQPNPVRHCRCAGCVARSLEVDFPARKIERYLRQIMQVLIGLQNAGKPRVLASVARHLREMQAQCLTHAMPGSAEAHLRHVLGHLARTAEVM